MFITQFSRGVALLGLYGFAAVTLALPKSYTIQQVSTVQNLGDKLFLNENGQVAGTQPFFDNNGNSIGKHAFLWSNGVTTNVVDNYNYLDATSLSVALGLSNTGVVAGYGINTFPPSSVDGVVFQGRDNVKYSFLGAGRSLLSNSEAFYINDALLLIRQDDAANSAIKHDFAVLDVKYTGAYSGGAWEALQGQYPLTGKVDGGSVGELTAGGFKSNPSAGIVSGKVVATNDGRVVGSVEIKHPISGIAYPRAAVWTFPDTITVLDYLAPDSFCGERPSWAQLINTSGQIAGITHGCEGNGGFLWSKGKMIEFGSGTRLTLGALNAAGAVAGDLNVREGIQFAFVYSERLGLKEIQPPEGCWDFQNGRRYTRFGGLNDAGLVVGQMNVGIKRIIPNAPSGINPEQCESAHHAYIYENQDPNSLGVTTDLNALIPANSGWTLANAHVINNKGQILVSGNKGIALLTPVVDTPKASCDANHDQKVDMRDLTLMSANMPRTNANAPIFNPAYDVDGDGKITVKDVRKCVVKCNKPKCAA